ncbi:MAG TPA: sarcosine oxidase subunit delta [Methylomirabilota bacterium]|nr:sarcosine oxidase subunit delta [Methylomirabilota bacterium]
MRLPCPYCGDRDAAEFTYRGDAAPRRPSPDAALETWADYVCIRDNPAGPIRELWFHRAGCQGWMVVTRDTRSHAVEGASACGREGGP